jgi:hypothetical protein
VVVCLGGFLASNMCCHLYRPYGCHPCELHAADQQEKVKGVCAGHN